MKFREKNTDKFIEVRGVISFQSHERHTLIVFEDYEENTHTIEMPTNEFLEWFDKKTIEHAYKTYVKHLKSKCI